MNYTLVSSQCIIAHALCLYATCVIQKQNPGLPSNTLLHLPYLICYLVLFPQNSFRTVFWFIYLPGTMWFGTLNAVIILVVEMLDFCISQEEKQTAAFPPSGRQESRGPCLSRPNDEIAQSSFVSLCKKKKKNYPKVCSKQ